MADMTSAYAQLEQVARNAPPQLAQQLTPQIQSFLKKLFTVCCPNRGELR